MLTIRQTLKDVKGRLYVISHPLISLHVISYLHFWVTSFDHLVTHHANGTPMPIGTDQDKGILHFGILDLGKNFRVPIGLDQDCHPE
jgi:hypothetical protein